MNTTPTSLSSGARLTIASTLAALALFGSAADADTTAEPPRYQATFIAGAVGPAAINESGVVVGTNSSPIRGWVSTSGGGHLLLPLPRGAQSSMANDINDSGVIVGVTSTFTMPEFGSRATAWVPNGSGGYTIVDLGALPTHAQSQALAINNLGDIVGYSTGGSFRSPVRFAVGQAVQDLSATGIFDPQDVNDQREVVDRSFVSKVLDLDTMTVRTLPTPGSGYLSTTGAAINESGQVAGVLILTTSSGCDRQAARHTPELGWEVFTSCGPYNGAIELNDHGDTTMTFGLAPVVRFEGLGAFSIESLIDAPVGTWSAFTLSPASINNARQLVINATNTALNQSGAVLLTLMPASSDLDGDGVIGASDLAVLLSSWGECAWCPADITRDGVVNAADLAALLGAWGGAA